ncbi:MAG: iron-containing alcohol dehydrogenase [Desulfobacterales bacterium]|nr:MAG: iron-containing alcohol dehydrogenase [Desulfobacterales bacterium]
MRFEFATATRIIFGAGTVNDVAPLAADMGRHAIVVTGSTINRAAALMDQLKNQAVKITHFGVTAEPTIETVLSGIIKARSAQADLVMAIGGGSVIDTGKVIAALLTNEGELMDYLEVIGNGKPLINPSAPFIAIPTTAGTGAEVTRNSVLGSAQHRVKVSMRSPLMLPRLAVVDSELTHSMPPNITASTGLDAFTQLQEAFVSNMANPMIDGICREGMRRAAGALQRAYEDGDDRAAREDMCLASLFGGLALANVKLGAVHGIAGPLGGMFVAAHGAICAQLLAYVMEANIHALHLRAPDSPALARYDEVARILTAGNSAIAEDAIAWVQSLCAKLNIAPLAQYGLKESDFATVIEKSQKASSMQGNPIKLTDDELAEILRKAI